MKIKTVFVAEGEFIIRLDLKSILERKGIKNIYFFSDVEALLNRALAEPPDLIIADIRLKNQNTATKSAEILWEKYNVPFLFLSAYNMKSFKKKYEHSKCEFLEKPFSEEELLEAIYRLLNIH